MKETERIIKLLEDLYEGDPWIGVNLKVTLEQITPEQAAKKILPDRNSVWQILNHIISWRLNVLQRLQGKEPVTPDNNYFETVKDISEIAWRKALQQLKDSQDQLIQFLRTFREEDFSKLYSGNNVTYYEHIHGIIQHDAYHLGQIVLLAKSL